MRVSLFGLFSGCTNFMNPLAKLIKPDLPTFISNILFNISLYACMHILITSNAHPEMGSPTRRWQHMLLYVTPRYSAPRHSTVGFVPLRDRTLLQRFPLPDSWLRSSVDGIFPTRKRMRTRLCCRDFSLLEA